jgi:hypothetical protein
MPRSDNRHGQRIGRQDVAAHKKNARRVGYFL